MVTENEANGVSLGHLLSFFTGANYPPPMGFHVSFVGSVNCNAHVDAVGKSLLNRNSS